MVAHFKVKPERLPVHEISRENVEAILGRRKPWFQQGRQRGDDRHFAVCPYCDNPIQLKGLYKRQEANGRPYGSHVGTPVAGFTLDLMDMLLCPFLRKESSHGKGGRREMGPVALALIETAVSEFDRIVLILRDDFGFRFSDAFGRRMLEQWFDSEGYLYARAHLRNLPWMIAYLAPAQGLFGQRVSDNDDLKERIRAKVPQAGMSDSGRLDKGTGWFRIDLQCFRHKVVVNHEDGTLVESVSLRVQDFTATNEATKAPVIYEKQIIFSPDRFEALLRTPPERARRDKSLIEMAHSIASMKGFPQPG